MKFIIVACFILIALPIEAGTVPPASDFRCGQYIVFRGATQSEVLRKCGSPTTIETWEQERITRDVPGQSQEELSQEPLIHKEHIAVEEWAYTFGLTRFIYYLRFENGELTRVTIGGYGY